MNQKNAIVLCSGGIDSITTTYYVKKKLNYKKIILLFFDYGQRAVKEERKAVKNYSKKIKTEFIEIKLNFFKNINSLLLNKNKKVKKITKKNLKNTKKESKKWYVPCRNIVFLTIALSIAEGKYINKKEINDIFVGFKQEGNEGYLDTTPQFVKIMNLLGKNSCSGKFKIRAPLINKDKEDIINLGLKLGIDFENTISCYSPINKIHCGNCLACTLRKEGFRWSGKKDLTKYNSKIIQSDKNINHIKEIYK